MSINLKDTLNLPRTAFPMRASLVTREPERIRNWDARALYRQVRDKRKGSPKFILHDGPPFANGDIHLGHVLNKVLKDIVIRYKTMRGFDVPFVTGWDCHGLPIEHAVTKELRQKSKELEPSRIRRECEAFARRFIGIQLQQFKRLGILTDWDRHYETMDAGYEANILRTFAAFVEKGMVYRSKKPVYWSIPCSTALAEAEIEYAEHTSDSIWVAFPAKDPQRFGLPEGIRVVIWTTTPWTLPANLAIALHPRFQYTCVEHEGTPYLVARELAQKFISDCGWEGKAKVSDVTVAGENLEGLLTRHPFIDRNSPIVLADYVTLESGTGCVHTAPGHGLEDYQTGLKYGLEIYCPVNDEGEFVRDEWIPDALVGKTVLKQKGVHPANRTVLDLLKSQGALLHHERFQHQYPHCWRSKTPVIFRAMDQFFMKLDEGNMRAKVLEEIESVKWVPEWGKNRIQGAVESRPDWCISRQRSWGVPIPVFYNSTGEVLLDSGIIHKLAEKVEQHGSHLWFEWDLAAILEGIDLPEGWEIAEMTRGNDTLDVWFDSGSSHVAVLDALEDLHAPADLYLEGSDQHRGWFQSSIWTSVVAKGQAPYRTVLTHGFVVDENGRKMSKSQGAKTATEWLNQYGADILRLLIASEDYRGDLPIGETVITQASGIYRLIRNTLRFLIGNLCDFDSQRDAVALDQLHALDKWALWQLNQTIQQVTESYDAYDFPKVYQTLQLFCNNTLSATYHDIIKDRLYTLHIDDPKRRSTQTVLHAVLHALIRMLGPILPFTCDEALAYLDGDQDFGDRLSVLLDWPEGVGSEPLASQASEVDSLLRLKAQFVNEKLEACRVAKTIGQSLEASVTVQRPADSEEYGILHRYLTDLPELFIVSHVEVKEGEPEVRVSHAPGVRCPRSWRWVPELHTTDHWGPVSLRDKEVHDKVYGI